MASFKLSTKFNLILSTLLIGLFILIAYHTYRDQQQLVQKVALEEGQSVARQLLATFDHMSEIVRDEPDKNYALVPQVVATRIASKISKDSRYTVRQVSLRYRNPDNRPDAYEAERLKAFGKDAKAEIYQVTKIDGKDVFRYLQPLVADESCLKCHGTYEAAPTFIQQRFPQNHNSYNYQLGEVIGAVSFSKPMADLNREVAAGVKQELIYLGGILLLVVIATLFLVRQVIIKPIELASKSIHRITSTGDLSERIPAPASRDEVGQLLINFNQMMEQLDLTSLQRQESEDRYRSLIEASQSAIITFLENGKIVISNQLAEELFGISRTALLGESIFSYLEDGKILQQRVALFPQLDKQQRKEETGRYQLRNARGQVKSIDVTLVLASETEDKPLFTAILRSAEEDSR
jgi:PAS domain S-box-containing protein